MKNISLSDALPLLGVFAIVSATSAYLGNDFAFKQEAQKAKEVISASKNAALVDIARAGGSYVIRDFRCEQKTLRFADSPDKSGNYQSDPVWIRNIAANEKVIAEISHVDNFNADFATRVDYRKAQSNELMRDVTVQAVTNKRPASRSEVDVEINCFVISPSSTAKPTDSTDDDSIRLSEQTGALVSLLVIIIGVLLAMHANTLIQQNRFMKSLTGDSK